MKVTSRGLGSWHPWSLLLSRRMVWEESQELLAGVQVWAGLHGWACPESRSPPAVPGGAGWRGHRSSGRSLGPPSRLWVRDPTVSSSQKLLLLPGGGEELGRPDVLTQSWGECIWAGWGPAGTDRRAGVGGEVRVEAPLPLEEVLVSIPRVGKLALESGFESLLCHLFVPVTLGKLLNPPNLVVLSDVEITPQSSPQAGCHLRLVQGEARPWGGTNFLGWWLGWGRGLRLFWILGCLDFPGLCPPAAPLQPARGRVRTCWGHIWSTRWPQCGLSGTKTGGQWPACVSRALSGRCA